ncbi:MAG: hypothetical protein H0T42_32085 [Deltaproteobacteria bacterium]|nr:hypothetical protein [Deltaproteobacteria bacterium]
MRRFFAAASALALLGAIAAIVVGIRVRDSSAELENQVFTSRADRLRLVIPRGWRATDQPSYPGLLLWMMRSQPEGQIVLTAEAFTRELYCSWPIACRTSPESLASKYACALRSKLSVQRMRVGPVQPGPRDNEISGLPSVWFEYDDGKRFLRQAVALGPDRAVSLVLATPTNEGRAAHVRPFEQALRTLRALTAEETAPAGIDAGIVAIDGVPADASTAPTDAPSDAAPGAAPAFESAPAPKVNPVGPCPS